MMKKLISVLLLLAMLASLFAGLTLTTNAASYAYNNGKRGEVCTSLSSAAQSYWSGSYDYATLSAKTGDTLRTALRTKITSNRSTVGYGSLQNYFIYTDAYQGSSSQVMLFYAGIPTSSTWAGTANWNREHMWPDSLGGNAMEGDLHSMRPTDPKANSTRSNNKYGNAGSNAKECYTFDNSYHSATLAGHYSSGIFEPLDSAKGDCARVILYDYVVATSMSSPTVAFTDIQTMLDWCALDPVDTYEMQRNDIVQTIEGCRNPFVDYPELAWRIFSSYTMPANMQTPSGNTVSYTVNATSNNTNYGTVSVNGCVITASPKTGYYAKDYTVTSGTASVTQNGNTFTVTPSSDCTVRINFAAKTSVTVTLNNNGSTSTRAGYAGEAMTLTMPTAPTGYTAVGWVSSSVSDTSTKPATVYTTSFTPTGSCTLYALFSHVVGGGGGSGDYEKVTATSDITDGQYLIVYETGSVALDSSLATIDAVEDTIDVTISNNTIPSDATTDAAAFTYTSDNGAFLGTNGLYIGHTGTGNTLNTSSDPMSNTVTITNGEAKIAADSQYSLRFNNASNQMRFRYYKGTQAAIQLYKKGNGGTTHYTTSTGPACSHTYTSVVTQPTCTAGGYTTYTCSKCGDTYTGNEIAALGHNYGSFSHNASSNPSTHSKTCSRCSDKVTETCSFKSTTSGTTTTHTCSVCHYSYTSSVQSYTVTFRVPAGVTPISAETVLEDMAMNLPTAGNVDGYTFCGWVTSTVDPETETVPAILTGSFMPDQNITLYALYSRTEAGSGSGTPTLTNMVAGDTIADGDKLVIVAHDQNNVALYAETQSGSYVKKYTFDNKVASVLADSKNYLTVNAATGGYTLGDNEVGYLYTSGSNNLAMSTTNNTVWTLSDLGDGTFNLVAANGRKLSYRYDLTSNLYWRMGGSAGTSGQTVLDLYKLTSGASSTTYYTTSPSGSTPHVHEYDSTGVCSCGDKLISIDSASLRLDEDIDVIYNATVPDGATASMTFTMNGTSVTVNDDGSHSFIFEGVTPQCMGDNISAALIVTYGSKTYSCTKATYSVKAYCTDMLAKSSTTATLRKLLSDTLAYGAAAQYYMGYKTNALVTSGVTGTSYSTFSPLSGLTPTFTGTAAESPCWTGVYVTLTDDVAMVFRFASPNKTGLSIKVTYNGKTTTFSGTSITAVSGMSGVYEVKLTGIKATDFGQTITAKFYKSSAQVGNTLGYSVNTYICAKQNDSSTTLKNLVRALYNYGASAAAYAG